MRRLRLERDLQAAPLARAIADATLNALPCAAFVLSAKGAVQHANAAGRQLLASEANLRAQLAEALSKKSEAIDIIPLAGPGLPPYFLARIYSTEAQARSRAAVARMKFRLSVRQEEIAACVLRGQAPATIAASLGCSERTVEAHLSAIFQRVGAQSRAELVAVLSRRCEHAPGLATAATRTSAAAVQWRLTPRETEVLGLVVRGSANKEIAAALRCAEGTIEAHVTAILGKAEVESRAALSAKFWSEL
jgi:DNA-binding NarL/FixJ family response regulator